MRDEDIAIIGVAALLPGPDGAVGLDGLAGLLAGGVDLVGPPSPTRVRHTGGSAGTRYLRMAHLDRIDLFDHRFFGIPLREAEMMDPHQRLLLQLAHEAVENACLAPGSLRGSRTAVVLGHSQSDYETLYRGEDPHQTLGALSASSAARISYHLNLTGPAYVVDTACSSSLTALASAVDELRKGTADLALAGGVSVRPVLFAEQAHTPVRGVESSDGRCRPFDECATGAVAGEGGAVVLLRRLRDAVEAGDPVRAVLKGIAVNHNGHRMVGLSAPSQAAQTEVVRQAWRDADVDPATVAYVECHGSATPLGDVIEVDALRRAFAGAGVAAPGCAIGSIKGNLGHLDGAAGMAGLLKALLSVERAELYPTAHFESPNPLLDLSGPVHVNPAHRPWPERDGVPRRAGVSALGMTGTNVHAVLEQPPPRRPAGPGPAFSGPAFSGPGVELVTVSAKSAAAFRAYLDRLADFAERTGHDLRTVAHAMNRGRDDHPFRGAFAVGGAEELVEALRSAVPPDEAVPDDRPVVVLLSGDGVPDDATWAGLAEAFPVLADVVLPERPAARLVVAQTALLALARSLGVRDAHLVGSGPGNLAVRVARGELSVEDAVEDAGELSAELDRTRLARVVERFAGDGAVLVDLGGNGVLTREVRRLRPDLPCVELFAVPGRRGVLRQLGALYRLGARLDWDAHYAGADVPRVEAPTYPFEPVRCWCRPLDEVAEPGPLTEDTRLRPVLRRPRPAPGGAPEDRVAQVWQEVLGEEGLTPDSDYFALGGTSIAGISVLRALERDFDVRLTFADLYAHPTVRALAGRVAELREAGGTSAPDVLAPVPRGGALPVSFGQEQLWYLDRLDPGTPLYNIPHDLRLTGPLDVTALLAAIRGVQDRHEVLRTRIAADDDGVPRAYVREGEPEVVVRDLRALPEAERHREARRIVDEEARRPFDLASGPLVRTAVLRLADEDHVLLWNYHHIVFDGWSPTVFFRDFTELYRAALEGRPPELPELPAQYADFAARQRRRSAEGGLDEGLRFWRSELAGLRSPELPLDRPRPAVRTAGGGMVEFEVAEPDAEAIRALGRRLGVTTFVTMLAVVDALLHRWARLTDVVVGVATSGRVDPASHDLIGYFNNVLPFRTAVRGDLRFTDLVRRCARTVADVLDHEEVPLEKVVAEVLERREPGRHPLFDVVYTYQNVPQATAELAGLPCTRYLDGAIAGIAPGTAKFDLTIGVVDQGAGPMSGYLEHAAALYDPATARRLATWLPAVVARVAADPDVRLDDLTVVAPGGGGPGGGGPGGGGPGGAPEADDVEVRVNGSGPPRAVEVLTAICADLLGADSVSPDDNFFALGGDSVLGVRVAARAAKAGVHITPQQLLQHPTVGGLAAAAVVDGAPIPRPAAPEAIGPGTVGPETVAPDARPIPLTPIMRSFLEHVPDRRGDFVEVHVVELTSTDVTADAVRTAVRHLAARHEPLRYRFRRNAVGTRAECAADAEVPFDVVFLPPGDEREVVAADCRALKDDLDLERGPLARARYYERGHLRGGLLVLLVHHFVFDNMSTVVLLDDLDALIAEAVAGRAATPAPAPAGWREWAWHLHDLAASDEVAAELAYWTAVLREGSSFGLPAGSGGEGLVSRSAGPVPVASASGREVALCATALGLARWSGADGAFLAVEGEATPNVYRRAGRGPSIGWFTSLHPVSLPVADSARATLPLVVDRARSVPHDGVGYGVLRHLSPHGPGPAALRALPEPRALLVHVPGDVAAFDTGVGLLRTRWDLAVHLKKAMTSWFPLIVAVSERAGEVRVDVNSLADFGQSEVEALADGIAAAYGELA
ncbi:condensation domain-containing protein [Saccharothrix longispora]|uniref:3-oxoacyl-(Acyl-carrier-protein) synthase/aryl carrier-like protein n=1 Tax=Saccharothrix longispora TaxID=33920 RepID=A0ABU1PUB7_9PSEU|nr:condensation domain-containing protein [Saccharothrix longispora]MDR6594248.1 3-oxoacyl-(acyl-carrier-protein) synthase/aryl carrier-like protein [Saccharothrix longispora]